MKIREIIPSLAAGRERMQMRAAIDELKVKLRKIEETLLCREFKIRTNRIKEYANYLDYSAYIIERQDLNGLWITVSKHSDYRTAEREVMIMLEKNPLQMFRISNQVLKTNIVFSSDSLEDSGLQFNTESSSYGAENILGS